MIELESVSKKFGATIALHETDLCIERDEQPFSSGQRLRQVDDFEVIIGLLEPTTAQSKSRVSASRRAAFWPCGGGSAT
jgi:ABC-type sugar transport systems, ATPase components